MRHFLNYCVLIFILLLNFNSCNRQNESPESAKIDLQQIIKRGVLRAVTGYSATSYFLYKGQPMGYQFELLQKLADHLGVRLEIILEDNLDLVFEKLRSGDADIIAHGLTVTKARRKFVEFTKPLFLTRQVLVQRKPDNWRRLKIHQIEDSLLTSPIDLIGKKIYVKAASSHLVRLQNLSEEIGGDINVIAVKGDTTSEELIQMVSNKQIDYTIADQHIAIINQAYFQNIDVQMPVSLPQQIAWAVRKNSPNLKTAIDEWLREIKSSADYYVIFNKYFKNRSAHVRRAKSEFLSLTGGKISKFDTLIKKKAEQINWDWRLLAALIYQESQFDPATKSWSGAKGLMQLMPATARQFGAQNLYNPQENLTAGSKYLQWLDGYWKKTIPLPEERIKFVLASYNVGIGHVADARKLTLAYGQDATRWEDNVAEYLLKLSDKEFYNDPLVEFGYCRGLEPFKYVNEILERFETYQIFIEDRG